MLFSWIVSSQHLITTPLERASWELPLPAYCLLLTAHRLLIQPLSFLTPTINIRRMPRIITRREFIATAGFFCVISVICG